jgi:hypothetical protein
MYSSYARVDREIADRQLLEQMNKLERDKRHKQQDGPLIPLTLGMLVLMCCLPFIASRLRRASSRQQQQQQQAGVLGFLLPPLRRKGAAAGTPGRPPLPVPAAAAAAATNGTAFGVPGACPVGAAGAWAPSASAAAPGAAAGPTAPGSIGGGGADGSALQRAAAAAVKAALSSSSDLEAMESALRVAEKAGMGNTANCVRLRELLAKRKRQAQQAKRQEQMRQQEQARKSRKGRKGQQESAADGAAAPDVAQQAAGGAQQQQQQADKESVRRPLFRAPAWLKQVLPGLGKKGKQAADSGDASCRGLGRVSDSSSTAAAAASGGISRSCSISSSRSASSSMISSSPSLGLAPLADLNTSASSRGCSPATSVSCSPQSSITPTPAAQQQECHPSDTPAQQQRSTRRAGRGSVTVAVAPRSSKQQQHQQQAGVDADVADLADSLLAARDTTEHSSVSRAASSPQEAAGGGRGKKQQHKGAGCEPADLSSPTGTSAAANNLPIYTPPKQRNSNSPAGSKAAAGGAKGAAGKGSKGKQQPQAVSLSAAAPGCESAELFGHDTPRSVITASAGLDSSARSSSGTLGAATVGVEPPATPAGKIWVLGQLTCALQAQGLC